jgi:hypothetical protein
MIKIKQNPDTKRSISAPPLVPENKKKFLIASKKAIHFLTKKFGKPFLGKHRVVFFDLKNDQVLKVPFKKESGIAANFQELDFQDENLAKTELDEKLSLKFGIPIIRMELVQVVDDIDDIKNLPDWVVCIDCQQVGYTKQGRLVAYDWDTF